MKITNTYHLPESIVRAVVNDPYDAGGSEFTASTLVRPPQITGLMAQHYDELEEDASGRIWALLGQAVHAILERSEERTENVEQRIFSIVDGSLVSMQFDRIKMDLDAKTIQDFKVTSAWTTVFGGREEWTQQLNIGVQLCWNNAIHIEHAEIVAIYRDWTETNSLRYADYPKVMVDVLPITVWSEPDRIDFIREQVQLHRKARQGDWRPCTDKERWAKPTTYAVMKIGRQSAVRVFDNLSDANAYLDEHQDGKLSVQTRPGESARCSKYCLVAQFCPQFRAIKAAEPTTL